MNSQIILKGSLNTITRISPLALYMGCVVSGLVFEDQRALVLLGGFFFVEMLSFFYSMNNIPNPRCALFKSDEKHFNMPAPIPTVIGFLGGFLMCEMFEKQNFSPFKFFTLGIFILVTIWSRINVGCHTVIESVFAAVVGIILGFGFYYMVKDYYIENTNTTNKDNENENQDLSDLIMN